MFNTLRQWVSGNRSTAEELKRQGDGFLDLGRWDQAEACFRRALARNPDYLDAQVNLGFALYRQGAGAAARQALTRALELAPHAPDPQFLLALIAQASGNSAEAIGWLQGALVHAPDFEPARRELGRLLFEGGQFEAAHRVIAEGLQINPRSPELQLYLGNLHMHAKQFRQAIDCYRSVTAIQPDNAAAHNNLGLAAQADGRMADAIAGFERALALDPGFAEAHSNLAAACHAQRQPQRAVEHYRRAIALAPANAEAHAGLGNVLQSQGLLEEAIASCRRAVELDPACAAAQINLGFVLQAMQEWGAAAACHRRALELNPEDALAWNNLGNALQMQGHVEEAISCYRRGLAVNPDYADAHGNLGSALLMLGDADGAVQHYRRALALTPDSSNVHSNLLFATSFSDHAGGQQYLAEARRYGRLAAAQARPYTDWADWSARQAAPASLRIGLVSGDLRAHPVAYFLEAAIANLDRTRLQLIAYPTQAFEDEVTARLKPHFSAWTSLVGLSDEAAARRIREDRIDILIDLAGHTAHNRLPLFCWKPAPLQVSWLGYAASTGVAEIDYILVDRVSVPEQHRSHFTEQPWYLPDTRLCFSAPAFPASAQEKLRVAPPPLLANGYPTFGNFQNLAKLDDTVLALWGRIFSALPQARLRLQSKQLNEERVRAGLRHRLEAAGIDPGRVTLSGGLSREEFFLQHHQVDVLLDTFPVPGGTTTCEALWMGVPTLTMAGNSLLSRQGMSLLSYAGLPEWVAADEEEYVAKAVAWARDAAGLARLRETLRAQVLASPVFDGPRFARGFEQAMFALQERATAK